MMKMAKGKKMMASEMKKPMVKKPAKMKHEDAKMDAVLIKKMIMKHVKKEALK